MLIWMNNNLPLLAKGVIGSLLGVLGIGVLAGLALAQLNAAADRMDHVGSHVFPDMQAATELVARTIEMEGELLRLVTWGNSGIVGEPLERQVTATLASQDAFREAVGRIDGEEAAAFVELGDAFIGQAAQTIDMVSLDPGMATMFLNGTIEAFDPLREAVEAYGREASERAAGELGAMSMAAQKTADNFTPLALAAAAIGLIVTSAFTRTVVTTLRSLTGTMVALADDDLDVDIPGLTRRDELGQMARSVAVFKSNAIEKRQVEKDLADYREHLEELVEVRTREIERQKAQIEEALCKEKELSGLQRQFVSMVSHEFRTPLAIIDGNAQRLLRRLGRQKPDQQEPVLLKIRTSVIRLTDLMESVLSAARLENGQINFDPAPCSLIQMIDDVTGGYRELHPERSLMVDVGDLPDEIVADVKLLRQILSNLISNAIKYSPGKTYVWINGSIDQESRAVITVRDDGLGIPAEEHEKLFQRFFRASTSTGIAGSGIGLHLSAHLVSLHGGVLDFDSTEGEGTAFSMHLPQAGSGP